jgi:arsenite oxidase large subunit
MYKIVRQNGEDVHVVIKPDRECVVNSGLGSVRGARMAEMSYSQQRNTRLQRLSDPMVWRYGQMQPTGWADALDLVARVTVAVINDMGEDGLIVSAYDHGGAGGGYENTWGTGKLYFGAMKIKNIRIHNRPAYNSEVHATRDMGVGELNNCYEDAELADTIVAVGTNALETLTNYFLNHWIPNLRGTSMDKKKAEFGSEPLEKTCIVIVDPRRTVTVNACEVEAGKDNVMHFALNSGTDRVLFNAWMTYIAEKGWTDKSFIEASTTDGRPSGRLLQAFGRACRTSRRVRRQAADGGKGRRASYLGMRSLQDDAERLQIQAELQEAHRHGEGRHDDRALWRPRRHGQGDRGRDQEGRPVRRRCRYRADEDRRGLPCLAAGGDVGRSEPHVHER